MVAVSLLCLSVSSESAPQWAAFTDLPGHFSVEAPGPLRDPTFAGEGSGERGGYAARLYAVHVDADTGTALYGVGFLDYRSEQPKREPEAFLDAVLASIVRESEGTLERSAAIRIFDIPGLPAREFRFTATRFKIEEFVFSTGSVLPEAMQKMMGKPSRPAGVSSIAGRIYLVNHRIFLAWAQAERGSHDERAAGRFLGSFRVFSPFLIP